MIRTHPTPKDLRTDRARWRASDARFSTASHHADTPPVVGLIGNTPLVPLKRVAPDLAPTVTIWAKLEGFNPGGSVKDRPALFIVQQALHSGALGCGQTLLDATSGNTGIAYAMLGAALGFPVRLALAADVSRERIQILRAYGADLILTNPAGRTDGAREAVRRIAVEAGQHYFYADQYSNLANPLAHYATTGPEIWQQTQRQITHFVAGMGTSGTVMGTGRYLREQDPAVRLIGVQPDDDQHGIQGLKYLAAADVPAIYDPAQVDQIERVSTEEATAMARGLARREGLFVGISAGAAVVAALRTARTLAQGYVVALLPDGGFKYSSAAFWTQ